MSRYIDADALIEVLKQRGIALSGTIADQPSIDIVRCKECKYWWETTGANYGDCEHFALDTIADDFCSYGERRVSDGR